MNDCKMTKSAAIAWIKRIQEGDFDKNEIADLPKDKLVEQMWGDPIFVYGMEYGAILAAMKIFKIKKKDLI